MTTIVEQTDCFSIDQEVIKKAAGILQRGGLVAFPTETVYGLGANGLSGPSCKKIYEAKGRPSDNPLILHIADRESLFEIVKEVPELAVKAMDAFWPGPLTMIFQKADCVPKEITGGFDTVAVRFPSHPVAQAVIKAAGLPIAAPSANSSGKPSPTRASHVMADLDGKIDMVIDGGPAEVGLESTILDMTGQAPMLLRPGAVTMEMLEELLGRVMIDPAVIRKPEPGLVPRAPGMKYKHYAPNAEITLVQGEADAVCQYINEQVQKARDAGKRAGVIATEETKHCYQADAVLSFGMRSRLETVSANLFLALRQCDVLGLEVCFAEAFPEEGEGLAVMNRLKKAAGYRIVYVS